ncbi:MAG TPA: FAD-linked oxidase C-terminal domain-containing protein [Streptosporangiaceae bacterium]|jgi:glycolate oxidase|nr:FAD-linked oxidase C-terminal domain-containing protein [Streptosporangiaceae bacterium]
MSDVLGELRNALPEARVITDPDVMDGYRRDQTPTVFAGKPLCVVVAHATADVAATLAWAQEHGVPVVPRGGGTSLAGGATATDGCVVLSTARMTTIREVDPANEVAVAEAGVINADLDRAAAEHGLMYAPDPSSYEISTIGGNLATNAGGLRCVKYGVTRDSVLGLEVVLAGGRVLRTGRRTVKGVTGYDLTSLFVGSEGTLGVITSATLRLRPRPATYPKTMAAGFDSFAAAARAVTAILAARIRPSLLELMDRATLRAIDDWKHTGFGQDIQALLIAQDDSDNAERGTERMRELSLAEGAVMADVSASDDESRQLLDLRRLAAPAVQRLGVILVEDVCVPRTRLPEMVERIERAASRHEVFIATVAHAGDGNLHPVFVFEPGLPEVPPAVWAAADEVFRAALDLGGTLTGEHGVGMIKRRWLADELGSESMAVHHAIKAALDPVGILNPGKAI